MTEDQVMSTVKLVPHDFFLVFNHNDPVASALVYHVTDRIGQVVYWGDEPGHTDLKPINYISYQLIQYYIEKGFDYLDIGPSTENGVPNVGLCNLKKV